MTNKLRMWYEDPGHKWVDYLPMGNGRLGAMVSGHVYNERIALNEDTLWTGTPKDEIEYDSIQYLDKARTLILNEQYNEAQKLMNDKLLCGDTESYAPLGDLYLDFPFEGYYTNYQRELDLKTAITSVQYKMNGVNYKREAFVSAVDQALIIRLTADKANSISFIAELRSLLNFEINSKSDECIALKGVSPKGVTTNLGDKDGTLIYSEDLSEAMRFLASLRVIANKGYLYENEEAIHVRNASEVTLILVANTSFNGFDKQPGLEGKDEGALCKLQLEKLEKLSYDELRQRHLKDYQQLFSRVDLTLVGKDFSHLPTDKRLDRLRAGKEDLGLINLYFQYGRYLLISSSRRGTQPANLQGIWNQEVNPPWRSNYTVNINTEMNYWGAEVCHLSECHEPLFDLLKDLTISGGKTAKDLFDCRGWTTNHNVDLWRYSKTVRDSSEWGFWPMGGAWMCQHLWEHYDFTRDINFLKSEAYPIMKGAAIFLLDYLIEDQNGNLVTCPSTSPENNFLDSQGRKCCASIMSTMDLAIIRDLFNNCLIAIQVLNIDIGLKETLLETLERLPKYQINKYGGVCEWFKDFEEYEPGHRHMSHLFGLYPGKDITQETNQPLFEASKKTLERRLSEGGGHTGWSCAWIINLYARLKEPELAQQYLNVLLTKLTYSNLFCVHPPFQIDGNFGGMAGIAEMLIQSHTDMVELLPVIPRDWHSGSVKGLKARGGFIIDCKWENHKITQCYLTSTVGGTCKLKYLNECETNCIDLQTEAGKTYQIIG